MISVVAFIHTYAQDGEFGSYMNELIEGFIQAGVNLYVIRVNDLVNNLGARGYKNNISDKKVVNFIKSIHPAFVFTTNRGGITKRIMSEIDCPIVTWMVDRIPFLHHGGSHDDLFSSKDFVITSSFKNVSRLENIYPILKGRVFFLPFATNIADFCGKSAAQQDINISFVGTYFYCRQFTDMLEAYSDKPLIRDGIIELAKRIEIDYDLDIEANLRECNVEQVLTDFNLDIFKFKGLIANTISLNNRIKALDAVSDLGLKLYGTKNWFYVNQYSLQLLRCYNFDTFIKTREDLVRLYQRSKIAFNISHAQAVDGLPYRIFDIMASDALLLTNYRKNSDLFMLFGKDMPIPMYRSPEELREMAIYYLSHEDERRAIVNKCQKLVGEGFSFKDRIFQFFDIIGAPYPQGKGELVNVNSQNEFCLNSHRKPDFEMTKVKLARGAKTDSLLICLVRQIFRKGIEFIFKHTSTLQRQKVKSFIRRIVPENWLYGARDFIYPELRGKR